MSLAAADNTGSSRGHGSVLGHIDSRNSLIEVAPEPFWKDGISPPWAREWGTDQYGRWVVFAVETAEGRLVRQRMRWIPAGAFMMGSPETEAERYRDEGPRHEVTISRASGCSTRRVRRRCGRR